MPTGLIILGRDGVINEGTADTVRSPADWRAIPGSLEAIAKLNRASLRVVVATNQPGIKRRFYDVETLNRIHEKLHRELATVGGAIEAIFFCPCHPKDNCDCHKPNPGMLVKIAARLGRNLNGVPMIGDSMADLQAAIAAGATPILVCTGDGAITAERPDLPEGVQVFANLAEAVDRIVATQAAPDTTTAGRSLHGH